MNNIYQELTSIAGQLKLVSSQLIDVIDSLKNIEFSHIGENTDIWSGDIANLVMNQMNELDNHIPQFIKIVNECSNALVDEFIK